MKRLRLLSLILHFFVGIGAIFGGSAAILNPEAPLGMPVDVLRMGPFDNFLIPGFFLFTVLGLGHLLSGILIIRKIRNSEYITGTMGAALIGWLVVQCLVMQSIHILHITFFIIGCLQGFIAMVFLKEQNKFPWTMLSLF